MTDRLRAIEAPDSSPWGHVDFATRYADGIYHLSTPGHGGFWLAAELNDKVPDYMRNADGFYEEDVDWCVVITVFPEIIPQGDKRHARAEEIMRHWKPEAWQAFHGKTLDPSQSHMLARSAFEAAHQNDQIAVAAWASPVPGISTDLIGEGKVLVCARRGGRQFDHHPAHIAHETWHIVSAADYDARSAHGFLVPAGTPETDLRPYGK